MGPPASGRKCKGCDHVINYFEAQELGMFDPVDPPTESELAAAQPCQPSGPCKGTGEVDVCKDCYNTRFDGEFGPKTYIMWRSGKWECNKKRSKGSHYSVTSDAALPPTIGW